MREPEVRDERHSNPQVSGGSTSLRLLLRARAGDREALDRLFERLLPSLRRWARGRLPRWARDAVDTGDLVQEAVTNTLRQLPTFAPRRQRALQAYLRQAIRNRIRDELRRFDRRQAPVNIDDLDLTATGSLIEDTIERDNAERYRAALARMSDADRELIVGRLELGYSYAQIALATGRPTEDAARMAVKRSLVRLAEVMATAQA